MADLDDDPFAGRERIGPMTATGGTVPAVGDSARRAEERRLALAAEQRRKGAPLSRQVMAAARQAVSGMPIVRRLATGFTQPEEGTQEAQDLNDLRVGSPNLSTGISVVGGAVPYAGAASIAPRLFGSLIGAMGGNATIGATDAQLGGENPAVAGLRDAALTVPGALLGRLVTPRGAATTGPPRAEFDARRLSAVDDSLTASSEALQTMLRAMSGSNRGARGRFQRVIPPDEALSTASQTIGGATENLRRASNPTLQIPPLSSDAFGGLNARDIIYGLLAAGGGQHMGMNPFLTGAAGVAGPRIAQMGADRVNRAIEGLNRRILSDDAPGLPRRAIFSYLNNQVLSDRNRAMLNAISPSTTGAASGPLSEVLPEILVMLAGGDQPPAPTLGGN